MRHQCNSRRLGRRTAHRVSMLKNLTTSLLKHKRITTTLTRAKEVKKMVERVIAVAKAGDLASKRYVFSYVSDRDVARDLFDVIAPQYKEAGDRKGRPGGFTRIIQIGPRKGDAAPMVFLELV